MPTNGRCLCGEVKVSTTVSLTSADSLVCHCTNCKRRSGGVSTYAFLLPHDSVTITGSTHTEYSDPNTSSGKPMKRSMCSYCGSPVRIIEGGSPDVWCMQYGLFAEALDGELPKPKLELFRGKACSWVNVVGEDVKETQ